MKRIAYFCLLSAALAVGCGGDDDPGMVELHGFMTPTETLEAWREVNGVWELQGPANMDCLNTASDVVPTTVEVTLSGGLEDFQSGNAVPDGTMEFFADTDFANPFDSVVSDENGAYTATVPIGTAKYGVKITAPDTLATYQIDYELASDQAAQSENFSSVSTITANALPAFIGVTRTVGLGVLAGSIRDCDGNELKNAIATVSSVSGSPEHLDGAASYYFSAGTSSSLPVRWSQQLSTNKDSLYVIIELPPTSEAYLQVWGFLPSQNPETDEPTLIAETPAPVLADSVITASLEPLRN